MLVTLSVRRLLRGLVLFDDVSVLGEFGRFGSSLDGHNVNDLPIIEVCMFLMELMRSQRS